MAQLNTRIVLRNDITSNYEAVKNDLVLLKGEVGIEFNPDLAGKVKIKIGDGTTPWSELSYFGVDTSELTEALGLKADKSYVDEELAKKAVASEVIEALALKANVSDVYTKSEVEVYVNNQIGSAGHLKREIVDALPLESSANVDTIYMLKKRGGLLDNDHYEEYMIINGAWELIGDTYVDLTNYATKSYVDGEIDAVEGAVALKADQSALDTANENIAKKADTETINAALDLKADKAQVATDISNAVAPLAIETEVESALALKANKSALDQLVQTVSDNKEEVDNSLLSKADKTYVSEELAKKANKATTLSGYGITDAYTKNETYSRQEITDLISDITGGESAAGVLAALNTYKGENDSRVGLVEDRVRALEEADDDNIIEIVKVAGAALNVIDKAVDIPSANIDTYGVVKLSSEVGVDEAGALEVKTLNINKISQTEGDWLILNGGTSAVL